MKPIPEFVNEKEEVKFWAAHDSTDYISEDGWETVDGDKEMDPDLRKNIIDRFNKKKN